MSKVRYAVFKDPHTGNRYVIPGYSIFDDDPDAMLATTLWSRKWAFKTATGMDFEDDDLIVPVINGVAQLPHVQCEIGSRGFQYGYCTAYLIGSPEFEKIREGAPA